MDNFDLKKYLAEGRLFKEEIGDITKTGQSLVKNLTPEIKNILKDIKVKYPNLKASFVSNKNIAKVRGRNDLVGTYTLSYSYVSKEKNLPEDIKLAFEKIRNLSN